MTDSKSIPYSSVRMKLIVVVGVVERWNRIMSSVLVDLAEAEIGIGIGSDRVIRLTVVGVDRIDFLPAAAAAAAAAVAVEADQIN